MATNYVRATYSEIYDLSTSTLCPTLLGIHTPTSARPQMYLKGFFDQFKHYRYNGCSVTLVPASQLPVDPAGLSYEAGDSLTDPRDLMNPMLHFGMSGDDLGAHLDEMFRYYGLGQDMSSLQFGKPKTSNDTAESAMLEALYYQMLTSNSCGKTGLQQGFRKNLYPLVNTIASNKSLMPSYNDPNINFEDTTTDPDAITGWKQELGSDHINRDNYTTQGIDSGFGVSLGWVGAQKGNTTVKEGAQLFTAKKIRMGWLPTITPFKGFGEGGHSFPTYTTTGDVIHSYTALPKVFMYGILFPMAYKTRFYYRMIIKHHFEFKDFHSSVGAWNVRQSDTQGNWNPAFVDQDGVSAAAMMLFNPEEGDYTLEVNSPDATISRTVDSVS